MEKLIKLYLILIAVILWGTGVFAQTEFRLEINEPKGQFGKAVSISGEHVIVTNSGIHDAFIFRQEGLVWVEEAKLTSSDGDPFGYSASISGDRAIVTKIDGYTPGKAYIFGKDGGNWIEEDIVVGSSVVLGDIFGISSSIDGERAIVGAHFDDDKGLYAGAAYIFHFDGNSWVEEAKITADDATGSEVFGWSVSIDGDRVIVGAMGDDEKSYQAGAAYIFRQDGSNWIQEAKLTANDGSVWDNFGSSVSIGGERAVVGAYQLQKPDGSGAAYVFHFDGTNWIQESKLIASGGEIGDAFGGSVSMDGDRVVIGAHNDDDMGERAGSAYVFRWDDSQWYEEFKLLASDGSAFNLFGYSCDIEGGKVIVGTLYQSPAEGGAAYIYTLQYEVSIDIKPGNDPNSINCDNENALIPVAILTTSDFDATSVDHTTITFEGASEVHPNNKTGEAQRHEEDVDSDGDLDLVFHFRLSDTQLTCSSTEATLTGETYGGQQILGSDLVNMIHGLDKSVSEELAIESIPAEFALLPNYPNPFNPSTSIPYTLQNSQNVKLEVYDILGKKIATLVDIYQDAGIYSITFDAGQLPSGVYFYKLQAGSYSEIRKMILMR